MAIKYRRILYCTDFSKDADYALSTALDLAEKYQARIYVLHVIHFPTQSIPYQKDGSEKAGGESIFSSEFLEKGTKKLRERYEAKMGALKNNCEFHVVVGVPFVEIIRFARSQDVQFIVLGAAGSSNIQRLTFGSTAENVARRAHCTVLITRKPEKDF
jgi:nucleotide-binding universal stress UspA family protein